MTKKITAGHYELNGYEIIKFLTESETLWKIYKDNEWCETVYTKRDATAWIWRQ